MSKFEIVAISIAGFVGVIALAFVLELGGLEWKMFFAPKHQNVERKVFEQTKSYVHGQQQNLAKQFGEYQKADEQGKAAIRNIIAVQFAEFDAEHITNHKLRSFLVQCRGY